MFEQRNYTKKIAHILKEYILKQLIIALIVTFLGGLGIYIIQEKKEKETITKELVLGIIDICSKMENEVSLEFGDLLVSQQELKQEFLKIKIKHLMNKVNIKEIKSENYKSFDEGVNNYAFLMTFLSKYKNEGIKFLPYKEQLDVKMSLLKIYNYSLFNKINNSIYAMERSIINLRKTNIKDFNKSLLNSVTEITKLNLLTAMTINSQKMKELLKVEKSRDLIKKHMNEYSENSNKSKQVLFNYLKEENNKSILKKLFNF